jgi:hypothetical protein
MPLFYNVKPGGCSVSSMEIVHPNSFHCIPHEEAGHPYTIVARCLKGDAGGALYMLYGSFTPETLPRLIDSHDFVGDVPFGESLERQMAMPPQNRGDAPTPATLALYHAFWPEGEGEPRLL